MSVCAGVRTRKSPFQDFLSRICQEEELRSLTRFRVDMCREGGKTWLECCARPATKRRHILRVEPGGRRCRGGGRGSYGGYGETQCGYVLGEFVQGGGKDLVGELC